MIKYQTMYPLWFHTNEVKVSFINDDDEEEG